MTVVGIPLRPFEVKDVPPKLALNRTYFDALEQARADILPIPVPRDLERIRFQYGQIDALLLPGGADVEPRRYGAVARTDCNLFVMPELDDVELRLARWAIDDGKPVLGICRGIQVMNVACGGTLWQDLHVEGATTASHDCEPRDLLVHGLVIEPDSVLARTLGTTTVRVNSLHHQAIRELGSSLRCVAQSDDGLIEGIEMPDHRFVVGIQCHPEELVKTEKWAPSLFEAFVAAGAEYHAKKSDPNGSPL